MRIACCSLIHTNTHTHINTHPHTHFRLKYPRKYVAQRISGNSFESGRDRERVWERFSLSLCARTCWTSQSEWVLEWRWMCVCVCFFICSCSMAWRKHKLSTSPRRFSARPQMRVPDKETRKPSVAELSSLRKWQHCSLYTCALRDAKTRRIHTTDVINNSRDLCVGVRTLQKEVGEPAGTLAYASRSLWAWWNYHMHGGISGRVRKVKCVKDPPARSLVRLGYFIYVVVLRIMFGIRWRAAAQYTRLYDIIYSEALCILWGIIG